MPSRCFEIGPADSPALPAHHQLQSSNVLANHGGGKEARSCRWSMLSADPKAWLSLAPERQWSLPAHGEEVPVVMLPDQRTLASGDGRAAPTPVLRVLAVLHLQGHSIPMRARPVQGGHLWLPRRHPVHGPRRTPDEDACLQASVRLEADGSCPTLSVYR